MNRDYFIYKSNISYQMISKHLSPDEITKMLGIKPDRYFNKGDVVENNLSTKSIIRINNLWEISTNKIIKKNENISDHIMQIQAKLTGKKKVIEKIKDSSKVEVTFWIWLETDDVGVGLDLTEKEMDFLNSFSNGVHFSLLTNQTIVNLP